MMPTWLPVKDAASTPRSASAMTSSDMEIRSPVLTSMSYSRGGWVALTELARWISSSVVLPMALTTATTWEPCRRVRAMWSATARIRSASPTEVPPNFWTTSGIRTRLQTADRPRARRRPARPARAQRADPRRPAGLGRVSGRAQREESPSARGQGGAAGGRGQAQKRRQQLRNVVIVVVDAGVIVGIVFLVSGNNNNVARSQRHHAPRWRPRAATPSCRPQANEVAVKAGCPASPKTPTAAATRSTPPPRP